MRSNGRPSPSPSSMAFRPAPATTSCCACTRRRWRRSSGSRWCSSTSPAPAATSPPSTSPRQAGDGYTLLIGTAGTHGINAALYKKLPFDVEADFTPIAPIADVPNVLAVNPTVIDAKIGAGVHRHGEGGARQVQLRLDRQRRQHASGLCPVQRRSRSRYGARALQGQPRVHPGAGDGRGLLQLRSAADRARPVAGRQGAAAGRQHQDAHRHPRRRADGGRRRRCRASRTSPGTA